MCLKLLVEKDKAIMVRCLAQGHKCNYWDLNAPADQKHKSYEFSFVGCRGRADKSTELKLWCFCSAECGFES